MPEHRFVRYETLDDGQIVLVMMSRAEARDAHHRDAVEDGVRAGK